MSTYFFKIYRITVSFSKIKMSILGTACDIFFSLYSNFLTVLASGKWPQSGSYTTSAAGH